MKIKKDELQKALEIVRPGLANKEIIEQSTSFAFIDGKVVTYNDEISVSHPVSGLDITGAVSARELYLLLKKTREDVIDVSMTNSEIVINFGKEKAGFALTQDIKLPLKPLQSSKNWKKVPESLLKAIKFCIPSCSRDMSRPVLTCVHVRKDGIIEGSDGFRLTRVQEQELPIETFLIPASSAQHLCSLNVKEIAQEEGWVHFRTDEGTIFSCRIFIQNFPNTEPVFDVEGYDLELPRDLEEILDRAGIFSKKDFILDSEVFVSIEKDKMKVKAEGATSWFEAEIDIQFEGTPFSFTINPEFLREICSKELTCTIGENRILFTGTNWKHVIALTREEKV